MQQNTIEDFGDSLSSEEEEMELLDQEAQSRNGSESSSGTATSPTGVESVQGNGTFSLLNKQRFFLSMFMFAFMFLGPGKLLFGTKSGMSCLYVFISFSYILVVKLVQDQWILAIVSELSKMK